MPSQSVTVEVVPFLPGSCAAQVCWPAEDRNHNVWPRRWQLRGTGPQPENLPQTSPHPKRKRLTNAADIVESSKPQFSLLLNFTQTRTRKAKADQVKNNAVAVLSQGARLSDILGRDTRLLAQASNPSWKGQGQWFYPRAAYPQRVIRISVTTRHVAFKGIWVC